MKQINIIPTRENLSDEEIVHRENIILENYVRSGDNSFKKLFNICKEYKKELLISALFCTLQLSAMLFLPIATANIIDAIALNSVHRIRTILTNLFIAIGLLCLNAPMQRIYMNYRNEATRSIEATLRTAIVSKLQKLTFQFHKEMSSGRIQSKIMRDVESIRNLISQLLTSGIHITVNIVTIVVVLVVKGNIWIMLFFLLCGPMAAILGKLYKKKLKEESRKYRKTVEDTTVKVNDMVDLSPVTKAHDLGDYQTEKIAHAIGRVARCGYEYDDIIGRFIVSNWLVMQFFQLACLGLSTFLACKKWITVGDVTMYQSYFSSFVAQISSILSLLPIIASGFEAVDSIGEILSSDDMEKQVDKFSVTDLKGEYVFEKVSFHYRDDPRLILDELDLKINAGETVALVGESGSGKTTILNLVTGFNLPVSGKLTIDGIDINDIDFHSYRSQMAVVLQNSILFSGSIRENITYGLAGISDQKLNEIIELSCLRDVIDNLPNGIETLVGEHGNKLSGGQKQRISIARALIRNPKVIILDEATSALDTVSEKHIQTALENLTKGRTTLIVAHRLSTIKNADKIAVIANGKCIEYGTFDELIEKKGAFYRFRNLQI